MKTCYCGWTGLYWSQHCDGEGRKWLNPSGAWWRHILVSAALGRSGFVEEDKTSQTALTLSSLFSLLSFSPTDQQLPAGSKKKNTLKMGNCQVGTDPISRGRKAQQAAVWASIRVSAPRLWSRQLFGFKCNHYAGFPKNNVAFVAYSAWWIQPRAAAAARCAQH